jgi:hypothetical protein
LTISDEIEWIKAIPRSAIIKRAVIYFGFVVAVVLTAKIIAFPALREYLATKDPAEALARLKLVMLCFGLSLLPIVTYLAWLSSRIIRSRQFPSPGATVWRDTRIERGRKAVLRGWVIAACAMCLTGLAIYAAYLPYLSFGSQSTLHHFRASDQAHRRYHSA